MTTPNLILEKEIIYEGRTTPTRIQLLEERGIRWVEIRDWLIDRKGRKRASTVVFSVEKLPAVAAALQEMSEML